MPQHMSDARGESATDATRSGESHVAPTRGRGRASTAARASGAPVGPGSLLWTTAGDPRSLLSGSSAGIMQLMLPGLGAGVTDHSNFFDDPFDRIFRSIPYIWRSIFTQGAEGDEAGRTIRDFHPDIKGVDHRGERYHALDPDIFWWAHATFTWEFFRARELFWARPLSRSERNRLYAETVTWYRRYGVSDRAVPPTYADFVKRYDDICRNELELTPAVLWVLDPASNSAARGEPVRLPGLLGPLSPLATQFGADLLSTLVYGSMPDVVRRRFDLPWSHTDRVRFAAVCAMFRGMEVPIRFGAMDGMFPAGTPHLGGVCRDQVVVAGPSWRQRSAPSTDQTSVSTSRRPAPSATR